VEGDYNITPDDTFQTALWHTSRRLTPQGTVGSANYLNMGFRHRIDAGTTIVATISDVLSRQGYHRVIDTPGLDDNYLRLQWGRIVYVGIVYGFGGPLSKKADELNYEQ